MVGNSEKTIVFYEFPTTFLEQDILLFRTEYP